MVEVKQHFQISLLCWITHIWDSFMSISNLTVHSFLLLNNCPFYECIQLSHRLNDRTVSWLSFWVRINQAHFRHWHAGICFPSLAFIKHLLLFYNFSITAPLFSDFLLFVCGHPHAGRFPCPVFGLMSMSLLKASFIYICVSSMPASPCSFHAVHFVPLALRLLKMIHLNLYMIPQFLHYQTLLLRSFFLSIWILASHFLNVLLLNTRLNPGYQKTIHLDSECGVLWSWPGTLLVTLWIWVQETLVPSFSLSPAVLISVSLQSHSLRLLICVC